MDSAEAKPKLKGSGQQDTPIYIDAKSERATGKGAQDSDIPAQLSGTTQSDGTRERAPALGGGGPVFLRRAAG